MIKTTKKFLGVDFSDGYFLDAYFFFGRFTPPFGRPEILWTPIFYGRLVCNSLKKRKSLKKVSA